LLTEAFSVVDERQIQNVPREFAHTPPAYRIIPCTQGDVRRAEAEHFVRSRFMRSHGAHIASFMPTLLLLTDSAGQLAAVAGYRRAADERLFLEQYLPAPVEQAIATLARARVRRSEIVEIGNFAAIDSRRARILMSFMPAHFLEGGARWIVFTATAAIREILSSTGGRCLELGAADAARVSGGTDEWGRYYSNDPRVMAGFLPSARSIPALWKSHHGD
jgi:hypothetical protein